MDGGVRTEFVASERYQGPPGIMHGGLVTTLADEIAAYAVISETGLFGFTVSLEARFKKPIRVLKPIEGLGRVSRNVRRLVTVDVTLAQAGELCFEGKLKFALLDEKAAEQLLGGPLPDSWRSYARRA
ncbi:MAG: PaaI family thioesterase [Deltaproteobacteria bacterium]|nr:PaaI family thioesterase [Deltaproteobacteria bacterium]